MPGINKQFYMNNNYNMPSFDDFTQALIAGVYFFFLGLGFLILKGLKHLSPIVWDKILDSLKEWLIQFIIDDLRTELTPIRKGIHDIKNKEINESSLADLSFDFFKNLFIEKDQLEEFEKIMNTEKNKQAKILLLIEKANELFGYDKTQN